MPCFNEGNFVPTAALLSSQPSKTMRGFTCFANKTMCKIEEKRCACEALTFTHCMRSEGQ